MLPVAHFQLTFTARDLKINILMFVCLYTCLLCCATIRKTARSHFILSLAYRPGGRRRPRNVTFQCRDHHSTHANIQPSRSVPRCRAFAFLLTPTVKPTLGAPARQITQNEHGRYLLPRCECYTGYRDTDMRMKTSYHTYSPETLKFVEYQYLRSKMMRSSSRAGILFV